MSQQHRDEEARVMSEAKGLLVGLAIIIGAIIVAGATWSLLNR